jgi:hypothetical protein
MGVGRVAEGHEGVQRQQEEGETADPGRLLAGQHPRHRVDGHRQRDHDRAVRIADDQVGRGQPGDDGERADRPAPPDDRDRGGRQDQRVRERVELGPQRPGGLLVLLREM